jgi:LysR family transcriptional activator of glutamate synthase operon
MRIVKGMLLRDLSWLVALADHEHMTDTAAILGVTQPTLSRALSRIEAELGTRLFERVPAGLRATPNGQLVVAGARTLVAQYEQLLVELRSRLDPHSGVVRLAFLDSMATSLVPQLLRMFHAEAPAVRVLLRQEPAHEILEDLRVGAAELAITSSRPDGPFGWFTLQQERLVLIVPPTHRLKARRRIALHELVDEEFVTTPVGYGYRFLVDGLLADAGITPRVSFESADLATIEGLVAAGLGVAVVPEQFAGHAGTVGIALTTPAARRTIGLTWRTDVDLAPVAARFLAFVSEQWPPASPRG